MRRRHLRADARLSLGHHREEEADRVDAFLQQALGEALREALGHSGFWLLTIGFFVCGFQVVFVGVHLPAYVADMVTLLARLDAERVDWVGTSMGGLIGLGLASLPNSPVQKLVLNDVGPVIQWSSLQRIGTYLGRSASFDDLQQAADAMWAISSSFGPHTPAQWLELSRNMVKTLPDGKVGLHYDPAIAIPFRAVTEELALAGQAQLWQLYDAITADTLLLRGADSDLLSPETAQAMTQRGPQARLVEFAGVGHAPTLIAQDQQDAVTSFLLG